MPRPWRFLPHDPGQVRQLAEELNIPPLVAQVLVARGCRDGDDAAVFLGGKLTDLHAPESLPGVADAAERVLRAVADGRRITVYGDYDVDGVTATALLWHCLRLAGAQVDYYIPHRLDEGYGLNVEALKQLTEEDPHRLLVTVDCGIAGLAEVEAARRLGLELIVTDHHRFAHRLPDADVLVHPRLPGSDYPFPDLCGAGVAFKLAWAICKRLGDGERATPEMREFLRQAVGLAAIGTIGDVVPLLGENRVLVRYGLGVLAEGGRPGLAALLDVAGIQRQRALQAEDVAFELAPRINAAGRLGQARLAVELLTTDNPQRARSLAVHLNALNQERRRVERRMFREAKELLNAHPDWKEHPVLVLSHPAWHAGVIGIVAGRMAERFGKPTVLIAVNRDDGLGQGSGRSYGEFDLHAALSACEEHLVSFGGHCAAAGLKVEPDRIDALREALCVYADSAAPTTGATGEPPLYVDAEVRLADATRRAVLELERLGPFGCGNKRPVFAATRVSLAEPPRRIGEGGHHLALKVHQFGTTMRAVAFGRGDWADEIEAAGAPISVCFEPHINRFNGRETVEMKLIDWQPPDHAG